MFTVLGFLYDTVTRLIGIAAMGALLIAVAGLVAASTLTLEPATFAQLGTVTEGAGLIGSAGLAVWILLAVTRRGLAPKRKRRSAARRRRAIALAVRTSGYR